MGPFGLIRGCELNTGNTQHSMPRQQVIRDTTSPSLASCRALGGLALAAVSCCKVPTGLTPVGIMEESECQIPAEVEDVAQLAVDLDSLITATGDHLASLVDGSTSSGGAEERTFSNLSGLFACYHAVRRRLQDTELSVGVLALAKSGKSTLVNALVGHNLMPANNVPETARITSVRHAPHLDASTARLSYPHHEEEADVEVVGTEAIRAHLRELNQVARERGWCGVREEEILSIEVPVAALAGVHRPGTPGVRLLDTPGPNEFGQDGLRYRVERLLEGVDAVLYLLDYTKLKTREEGDVLQRLREINPALVRRLCRRLHFVVNKCDVMESCEGLGEEETRQYVAALITEQLGGAGAPGSFTLHPDQVFLISARDALLARLVLEGRAGAEDRRAFMSKAFGKRWTRVKDEGEVREEALEMLKDSGILELEAGVMGFLASRCAVLRLVAVMDDLERLVAQISNLSQTAAGTLRADVATLHAQVAEMQARLERALSQFEAVQQEVQELEGHVVDEVRARLDGLRRKLEGDIDAALGAGGAGAPLKVAPRGRWPAIWGKAKRYLFGGSSSAANSPEEVQLRLAELHSDMYLQIEAEVKDFWHSLETATNDRQKQLFAAINARVACLSRLIESEVCQGLGGLALAPLDMRIAPPSAEQFHASLQELFATGIRQQSRTETQVRREQRVVFVKEHAGLCNSFEYWVPRTEESVVTEEVQVVSYSPDPDRIKEYFRSVVSHTTANSARHVKHYVHRYLEAQLAEARGRLAAYADSFSSAMSDALAVARQGEEERSAALAAAEAHCRVGAALLARVHALQATAEELLGPSEAEAQGALERLASSYLLLAEAPAPASPAAGTSAPAGTACTADAGASTVAALAQLSALSAAVGAEACEGGAEEEEEAVPSWAVGWRSAHSTLGASWTGPTPAPAAAALAGELSRDWEGNGGDDSAEEEVVVEEEKMEGEGEAGADVGAGDDDLPMLLPMPLLMGYRSEELAQRGEGPEGSSKGSESHSSSAPTFGGYGCSSGDGEALEARSQLGSSSSTSMPSMPLGMLGDRPSPGAGHNSPGETLARGEGSESEPGSLGGSQLSSGSVHSSAEHAGCTGGSMHSSGLLAAAEAAEAYAAVQRAQQVEQGEAAWQGVVAAFNSLFATTYAEEEEGEEEEGDGGSHEGGSTEGGSEGEEQGSAYFDPGSPLAEVPLVAEGEGNAAAGSAEHAGGAAEHAGLAGLSPSASDEEWTVVEGEEEGGAGVSQAGSEEEA